MAEIPVGSMSAVPKLALATTANPFVLSPRVMMEVGIAVLRRVSRWMLYRQGIEGVDDVSWLFCNMVEYSELLENGENL